MNRKLVPKRKCNSSPGAISVPAEGRAPECRETRQGLPVANEGRTTGKVPIKTRVIVSISDDMEFDRRLRMLAMQSGQVVIRVESVNDALRIVEADCCGIILLDLDSKGRTALEMAGDLLRNPLCPPVILLTGKGDQLDLRMTVFAGSVLEKSMDTFRILNLLKTILEGWCPGRSEVQSEIVRWEESGGGAMPPVPLRRFWGLNE